MKSRCNRSAALVVACFSALSAFGQSDPATPPASPQPAPAPATPPTNPQPAPAPPEAQEKIVYVKMTTSLGDIVLELDGEKAPLSTENFLQYAAKGHYDGTIFHRVIDGFMIQGGGFTPDLKQKQTDKPIKNEWKNGLKNTRGTVAMARTQVADSATSQFFINVGDNTFLDQPRDGAAYAVFGKVYSGMETVDKIRAIQTGVKNGMSDVPLQPVVIQKVTKITKEEAAPAGNG